jgi:hypothetical protein
MGGGGGWCRAARCGVCGGGRPPLVNYRWLHVLNDDDAGGTLSLSLDALAREAHEASQEAGSQAATAARGTRADQAAPHQKTSSSLTTTKLSPPRRSTTLSWDSLRCWRSALLF